MPGRGVPQLAGPGVEHGVEHREIHARVEVHREAAVQVTEHFSGRSNVINLTIRPMLDDQ